LVTLHHFTNPLWFAKKGGWLQKDAVRLFARYVETVSKRLPDVRYWITINEPTVYIKNGYGVGCWPPFQERQFLKAGRLMRRFADAHLAARDALHKNLEGVYVGFAHSAPYVVPCRSQKWRDRAVSKIRDFALNDFFYWLVRSMAWSHSDNRPFDFVGLNYYTRTIVR
jgi:beta-glucosidase